MSGALDRFNDDFADIFGGLPVPGAKPAPVALAKVAPVPIIHPSVECPPPGVYYDIPAHVYHQWPAIGSTLLKGYADCPATAKKPYEAKEDANVGSGIHAYTLQGEKGLAAECAIMGPECEGRGAPAKEAQEAFQRLHPGKVPLPHRYGPNAESRVPIMEVLREVDKAFREHPKAGPVLARSKKEVSLVWIDEETGLTCKARLDVWDADRIIWDVKKCRDLDGFQWQIKKLHYGVQAGWYFTGAMSCGLDPIAFGFLPCEAFAPYRVGCGYRDPDKLLDDCQEAHRLLCLVKESTLTGQWPTYRIPPHIYSLADIKPDDLMDVY